MHLHTLTKDNFTFETGGSIANLNIVYHTSPRTYQKGERVVWLCHALTANSDPLDWWPEMVGENCCINPDKDFVAPHLLHLLYETLHALFRIGQIL